ncbi:hypothetical protein [Flaviflexus massiliensis]|uniref:hypothetical protein n=1 Tax=Flaviflexus massiliensis TaxID=1522309 RepID=UPI0036F31D8E
MWHALRRGGIDIGREQTARLMRLAGVSGKGKSGSPITTRKANVPDLRPDLVEREFNAPGPGKLWVADMTYVRTRKGFVYARLSLTTHLHRHITRLPTPVIRSHRLTSFPPRRCDNQLNPPWLAASE